nr:MULTISPECIES: 16S rRNA (guanine(527)-N(7))-methyltransferase RsmG [unclassified Ruminococcus]
MTTAQLTANFAEKKGFHINQEQIEKLDAYASMLLEWNKKMNLTAITDSKGIAIKHFYDSLTPVWYLNIPKNSRVIDVGTGAGFPSIPMAILRPDLHFTLLDSLNKRLIFLNEVCSSLDIDAKLVHMRAEDAAKKEEYREKFDISVSRAVAALPVLCEYCLPFVKKNGIFVAMKGLKAKEELNLSQNAVKVLGAVLDKTVDIVLPDDSERSIIVIQKKNYTPKAYPRHGSKIAKQPL